MKLSELLQRRSTLVSRSHRLAAESARVAHDLDSLDRELFSRIQALAIAIEGDGAPVPDRSPVRQNDGLDIELSEQLSPRTRLMMENGFIRRSARTSKLEPQIIETMKEAGRPLSRNDLYALLLEKGIDFPGKDPKANLSAHLSYSTLVELDADGLWRLAEGVSNAT